MLKGSRLQNSLCLWFGPAINVGKETRPVDLVPLPDLTAHAIHNKTRMVAAEELPERLHIYEAAIGGQAEPFQVRLGQLFVFALAVDPMPIVGGALEAGHIFIDDFLVGRSELHRRNVKSVQADVVGDKENPLVGDGHQIMGS